MHVLRKTSRKVFFSPFTLSIVLFATTNAVPQVDPTTGYVFSKLPSKNVTVPPEFGVVPFGINDFGQVAGYVIGAGETTHSFLLSGDLFTQFDPPGALVSAASGINNLGQIAGFYSDSLSGHGYILTGNVEQIIDVPGAQGTQVFGINTAGKAVGIYGDPGGSVRGFLYSNSTFVPIDCAGLNGSTYAYKIDDSDTVVGVYLPFQSSQGHGFIWTSGICTTIDYPGATYTSLSGINGKGDIVGLYFTGSTGGSFLYRNGQFSLLNASGTKTIPSGVEARDINRSGQVVGSYSSNGPAGFEGNPPLYGTSGSNGHIECCSQGTLGSLINIAGDSYILSNNHVLGSPTSVFTNSGQPGDPILQPGLVDLDCKTKGRTVATLWSNVNLASGVDAAIAKLTSPNKTSAILDIGIPASTTRPPKVTMSVAKHGSTTNLTCGNIKSIHTSIAVSYTSCIGKQKFMATYDNLVVVSGAHGVFSAGGDSGSLIVSTETSEAIALLFASLGDESLGFPIDDVLKKFGASMIGAATHPVVACTNPTIADRSEKQIEGVQASEKEIARAIAVKEKYAPDLMKDQRFVIGIGVGVRENGESAVLVFVDSKEVSHPIPQALDGVPTKLIWTERPTIQETCPLG
jgi:hypothetical protein